jgi:hypothetical protein
VSVPNFVVCILINYPIDRTSRLGPVVDDNTHTLTLLTLAFRSQAKMDELDLFRGDTVILKGRRQKETVR